MEPTANAHWHHPSQIQQTQGYHPHPVSQTNQGPSPAGSNLPPTTSAPRSFIPTNESPLAPAEALFKNAWQTAQRQVNDEISKLNGELAATHSELRASTKKCNQLRKHRDSISVERNQFETLVAQLKSSHNELRREIVSTRKTGEKLWQDNRMFCTENEKHKAEVERLFQENTALQQANEVLQTKNVRLLDDLKSLSTKLGTARKEITSREQRLQEDWNKLWGNYKSVEDELHARSTSFNRMKQEWNLSRTVMGRIHTENVELRKAIRDPYPPSSSSSNGHFWEQSTEGAHSMTQLREEHESREAESNLL